MKEWNEQQLLTEYARNGAEAAFSELVQRHVQLVYGTALRLVRNPQLAEDLTQEVFLLLARKAPSLVRHPTLCGWLHLTARNLATKSIRSEARRRIREEEVADMEESRNEDALISWEELEPRVDELLGKLSEPDREALLLRFFRNKSAREMAEMLSLSADAAQKRVTRALERLRALIAAEGQLIGAEGVQRAIEKHSAYVVPAGLVPAIMESVRSESGSGTEEVEISSEGSETRWRITALAAGLLVLAAIVLFRNARARRVESTPNPLMAGTEPRQGAPASQWRATRIGEQVPAAFVAAVPLNIWVRYFPQSVWKEAGLGTPEDTLVTYMWAKKRGDLKNAISTATPRFGQELTFLYFQHKTDAEVAAMMIESAKEQIGFELLSKRMAGGDTAILKVKFNNDAPGDFSILIFKKLGNEWRIAGVEEHSGKSGEDFR